MIYYQSLFLAATLIHKDTKDAASNILCLAMSVLSSAFFKLMIPFSSNFFIIAILYDLIFLLLALPLRSSKLGKCIITVCLISSVINSIGILVVGDRYYEIYAQIYPYAQIALFEILVWGTFSEYLKTKGKIRYAQLNRLIKRCVSRWV